MSNLPLGQKVWVSMQNTCVICELSHFDWLKEDATSNSMLIDFFCAANPSQKYFDSFVHADKSFSTSILQSMLGSSIKGVLLNIKIWGIFASINEYCFDAIIGTLKLEIGQMIVNFDGVIVLGCHTTLCTTSKGMIILFFNKAKMWDNFFCFLCCYVTALERKHKMPKLKPSGEMTFSWSSQANQLVRPCWGQHLIMLFVALQHWHCKHIAKRQGAMQNFWQLQSIPLPQFDCKNIDNAFGIFHRTSNFVASLMANDHCKATWACPWLLHTSCQIETQFHNNADELSSIFVNCKLLTILCTLENFKNVWHCACPSNKKSFSLHWWDCVCQHLLEHWGEKSMSHDIVDKKSNANSSKCNDKFPFSMFKTFPFQVCSWKQNTLDCCCEITARSVTKYGERESDGKWQKDKGQTHRLRQRVSKLIEP